MARTYPPRHDRPVSNVMRLASELYSSHRDFRSFACFQLGRPFLYMYRGRTAQHVARPYIVSPRLSTYTKVLFLPWLQMRCLIHYCIYSTKIIRIDGKRCRPSRIADAGAEKEILSFRWFPCLGCRSREQCAVQT